MEDFSDFEQSDDDGFARVLDSGCFLWGFLGVILIIICVVFSHQK